MVLACGQPDPHLNPMLPDDIETTIKLFEDMVDWLATSVSINEGKTPNLQLQRILRGRLHSLLQRSRGDGLSPDRPGRFSELDQI